METRLAEFESIANDCQELEDRVLELGEELEVAEANNKH